MKNFFPVNYFFFFWSILPIAQTESQNSFAYKGYLRGIRMGQKGLPYSFNYDFRFDVQTGRMGG